MRCTKRPAFDGIVFSSSKNFKDRFIRQDANEVLDSMAMYIPGSHAVRALTDKGLSHEDALERAEMEWLHTTIATMSGAYTVSAQPHSKQSISTESSFSCSQIP
jgi:hypothetical protein